MAFCYLRVVERGFARVILPELILDRSGLYDSAVCRKDNIQCGIAPRQTKEAGLGRPASGQNSADDHQPVNDRESFTGILFLSWALRLLFRKPVLEIM